MSKYHISKKTGRPNICTAGEGNCPVGGDHYKDKDSAREAYEKSMASQTIPTSKKAKTVKPSISEADQLRQTIANRETELDELRLEKETATPGRAKEINGKLRGIGIHVSKEKRKLAALDKTEPENDQELIDAMKEAGWVVFDPEKGPEQLDPDYVVPDDDDFSDLSDPDWSKLVEEPDLNDDFSDIKCDDCGKPLDRCICDVCDYCGSDDPEWHEEDCIRSKSVPKAYSWD